MPKKVMFFSLFLIIILGFSGCGKQQEDQVETQVKSAKKTSGYGEEVDKAVESKDEQVIAEAMQKALVSMAETELQDFEKTEAIVPPKGMPEEAIYPIGKIMSAEKTKDGNYVDQRVEIRTTSSLGKVKEYYQGIMSKVPWEMTYQDSHPYAASYSATHQATGLSLDVQIMRDEYSKLTIIEAEHSGYTKD